VFNVVGGHFVQPCQDVLTTWYAIAEPCRVSVPCFGVRDPSGAKWSHRRCTSPVFGRIMIFLTSLGHLTLAVTSMVRHAMRGFHAA
jgi:hypothetical protein